MEKQITEVLTRLAALLGITPGDDIMPILAAAEAEIRQWREGGITEELLKRHGGVVRIGKKIVAVESGCFDELRKRVKHKAIKKSDAIAIARAEFEYWNDQDANDESIDIILGALGASANILAGIMLGKSLRFDG